MSSLPTDAPDDLAELEERVGAAIERAERVVDAGPYDATWASMADRDPAPTWFRDAKFGIYCHWGPYSVPTHGTEWYSRWMYMTDPDQADPDWGNDTYPRHVETYGPPDEAPYQSFVPEFTAERFDPAAWAELFDDAGARWAGIVAEHHDGWANWDSGLTPWNAGDRGPERDLAGDLASALRDRGLRVGASFHHDRTPEHYEFAVENFPSVTEGYPDRVLYGALPEDLFFDLWLAKIVEVIDAYEPDFVFHDSGVDRVPDPRRELATAYHLTRCAEHGREAVITAKHHDLPVEIAVEDFERGRPAELRDRPWLTDASLTDGGWAYTPGAEIASARSVIHRLVDAASKNGCLLLNVAPRPDGVIPAEQRDVLYAVGDWLDTHGDAIYGTRPWHTFGEGPTQLDDGGHFSDVDYSAADVRYTRDGETLYATVMGWPERDWVTLREITTAPRTVSMLGTEATTVWRQRNTGLAVAVPELSPEHRPSEHAIVFELAGVV